MEIKREWLDNYSDLLRNLSNDVREKLIVQLEKVDLTDIAAARDEIIQIMEAFLGPYTDMSATMAAQFYDGLREKALVKTQYSAIANSMREPIATDNAVRGIIQQAVDGNTDVFYKQLLDRAEYEIRKAAGECTKYNVSRDPSKPRYARVPRYTATTYGHKQGQTHNKELAATGTCEFCDIMASRGFVYYSRKTAGEFSHYHSGCDCQIVPQWGNGSVEGYDPDNYKR